MQIYLQQSLIRFCKYDEKKNTSKILEKEICKKGSEKALPFFTDIPISVIAYYNKEEK